MKTRVELYRPGILTLIGYTLFFIALCIICLVALLRSTDQKTIGIIPLAFLIFIVVSSFNKVFFIEGDELIFRSFFAPWLKSAYQLENITNIVLIEPTTYKGANRLEFDYNGEKKRVTFAIKVANRECLKTICELLNKNGVKCEVRFNRE